MDRVLALKDRLHLWSVTNPWTTAYLNAWSVVFVLCGVFG